MFGVFVARPAGRIKGEVEGGGGGGDVEEGVSGGGVVQTPLRQILHSGPLKQNSRLAVHTLSASPSRFCDTVAALAASPNPESDGFQRERDRERDV